MKNFLSDLSLSLYTESGRRLFKNFGAGGEARLDDVRVALADDGRILLSAGATVTDIVEDVPKGFSPEIKEKKTFAYKCGCTRGRMLEALSAIGRADLPEIYNDGKGAELCCHFCNKKYSFSTEEIGELLGV